MNFHPNDGGALPSKYQYALPFTVDTLRRIARTDEVRGLPEKVTSYDDPDVGQGTVVNEVSWEYDEIGLPVAEYQEHGAAVNTSSSPKVQYGYDDTADALGEAIRGSCRQSAVSH